MSQQIILPKDFNANEIDFSDVKTNNYGGKVVYLNRKGSKLIIQTPEMFFPYGLGENEIIDQKTNEVTGHKYHVNLSFRDMDLDDGANPKATKKSEKLKEFHQVVKDIDDMVVSRAIKNSLPWLKMKKVNEDTVRALYSAFQIVSKDKETQEPDGKYPDTIKGKIGYWDGKFTTKVFDTSKEEVDLKKNIVKGTVGKALLECTGIWFAGGKFGLGWRVIQMRVKVPESIQGYSFVDSDGEEDDEKEDINVNLVSDSDDDEDEEVNVRNGLDSGVNSDDD